jgi:hypothetical protein
MILTNSTTYVKSDSVWATRRQGTALHSAIEHGALNVVLMLLSDQQTDANVKDYSGLTPVAYSAARLVRMYAEWDGPFGHWVPRDNRPSGPSEAITEALLDRPDAVIELGDAGSLALDGLFVPAAQKASTRILKLLLRRWKEHLHITEERVRKAAAVGTRDSLLLLVQDAHIDITDSILEAAVRNKGNRNGTAMLKMLLEHRQREPPQRLPIIAASTGEPSTMELLLGVEGRSSRVTPEHLAAAAANKFYGKEMLSLLLAQCEEAQVTEEVVHAALRNEKDQRGITGLLLDTLGDAFPLTDTVVALAWEVSAQSRDKFMPLLLRRYRNRKDSLDRTLDVALRTASDAYWVGVFLSQLRAAEIPVPNHGVLTVIRRFGMSLLEDIFDHKGPITLTDEVVKAAAEHEEGCDIVQFLLAQAVAIEVSDEIIPHLAGEKSGPAIIRLLKYRGLIAGGERKK